MEAVKKRKFTVFEEMMHSLAHGLGAVFGIVALVLMISKTAARGGVDLFSAVVFGVALIVLYSASALYHASCAALGADSERLIKRISEKFDHCAIYILILGTYVPACLSGIGGSIGWLIFGVVAALCIVGITLNSISVRRFAKISLAIYILAGWTIIAASVPYAKAIGMQGFTFLLLGGALYTLGIIFYKMHKVKYMHILWHVFVLGGSVMHFIMVYNYCF